MRPNTKKEKPQNGQIAGLGLGYLNICLVFVKKNSKNTGFCCHVPLTEKLWRGIVKEQWEIVGDCGKYVDR
jgi:hypothetical protein